MNKEIAEFIGTFTLVLFGCGAAVTAGGTLGVLGIALAFGTAFIAMAYGFGAVSGCHINPAVSLGSFMAGRMDLSTFIRYVLAQCLGAIAGAFVLLTIMKGQLAGFDVATGLGQNGWGEGYMGGYGQHAAFLFELVATFIFVSVILNVTAEKSAVSVAGLAIGLTLIAIHLVGINITGASVNPARSLGPALFVGGKAMDQLWLFVLAPGIGGALAGLVNKWGFLSK